MDHKQLEMEFHRYCKENKFFEPIREGRKVLYNPVRFRQMAAERGFMGAIKHCINPNNPAMIEEGFMKLHELDMLDRSIEYVVLEAVEKRPEFRELFTEEELEAARKRLLDAGFDFKTKSVRK